MLLASETVSVKLNLRLQGCTRSLPCGDLPSPFSRKLLWSHRLLSQHALRGRARARLTGVLPKGGKMRGVATNVYSWKTSGKPKETGQNENSKFGSCIYT